MVVIKKEIIPRNSEDIRRDWTNSHIDSIRKYVERIDEEIKDCSNEIKILVCFSLIDGLAQANAGYPIHCTGDVFKEFLLKFLSNDKNYEFLQQVDPVTLYYRIENIIEDERFLDHLTSGAIYYPSSAEIINLSEKIVRLIENKCKNPESIIKKHRYIDLIYQLRNNVVHEFSAYKATDLFGEKNTPYYHGTILPAVIPLDDENSELNYIDAWDLTIPTEFIRGLCLDCANNYLDYCKNNNYDPFASDDFDRQTDFSWYKDHHAERKLKK